jgi:hypothetical protein
MRSDAEEGVAKGCKWRKMEENCEKITKIEESVGKVRKLQEGNS